MHANNVGLMGVWWWLKVMGMSVRSWINCPPEVFHLCETENIYFSVWPWGGCFLPLWKWQHNFKAVVSGSVSKVNVEEMTWQSETNSPIFLFHFKLLQSCPFETIQGLYVSYNWTTYTHSHMNLLIALLKKYELGIVGPLSLFWARMSVDCNMTNGKYDSPEILWWINCS